MKLIDTHCHIHESDYPLDRATVLRDAATANVTEIFCIGTDVESSRDAVRFAREFDGKFGVKISATVGAHPHHAKDLVDADYDVLKKLATEAVGMGEIGLDYFYEFSPRKAQIAALERQLQIAVDHNLPVVFHTRDGGKNSYSAFDDIWSIIDNFPGIRGIFHSFTDTRENLKRAVDRGFFIGVNGIMTFNKNPEQAEMYRTIPLDRMVIETDAPFLSPKPFRGKTNQPSYVRNIAEFIASTHSVSLAKIANQTTKNALSVFT